MKLEFFYKVSVNQRIQKMKLSATQEKTKKSRQVQSIMPILWVGLLAVSLLASFWPQGAQAQGEIQRILYINSYHVGYKFSDDITRALVETFGNDENIELRVEYLDTKRINDTGYTQLVYLLFQHKYRNADIDLIISSDDAALNFLLSYADGIFPDVPIVFVGANYFDESRLDRYEKVTGISEEADIPGTVATALEIHPNVDHIVVVNDTTVTGQNLQRAFNQIVSNYPEITFEFLEDVAMTAVQERVAELDENSLVLLTIFSRDNEGNFYEYNQFSTLVAESSAVPVYATWDFSLGFGVVGGKMVSGYTEGQRGAELALRVLNGENPDDIPVDYTKQSQYLFDYSALERYDIPVSALPEDSIILNRPVSFVEEYQGIILGAFVGFIVLVGIIIFLAINNNQRRRAQTELSVSNQELQDIRASLEDEVARRTQALETSTEVSRRLSTILDTDQLIIEVVEQLRSAFGYYHAHIYLLDEGTQNLRMVGGTGEAGRTMLARGHQIERGRGLVSRAAQNNQIVLIPDVSQAEGWLPNPLLPDTKAEVAVPMAVGPNVIGVLDVQHNVVNGLTAEDAELIQSIANQVAVAVRNAQAYEQAQQEADQQAQVSSISQRIQSATTIDDVLQIALRELGQVLGTQQASVEIQVGSQANNQRNTKY
jgi:putative methionine-R-sulfoxide reductase with GAF domain/ABC-type uncharacterized transport system substrate-binding protein